MSYQSARTILINNKLYEIRINPKFAELLVPLDASEIELLRKNLQHFDSEVSKILLWQPDLDKNLAWVIDGHNRYTICEEEGIELSGDCFEFKNDFANEDEVIRWIEDNQLGRRNLSKYARFEIIYRRDGARLESEARVRKTAGKKIDIEQENAKIPGRGAVKDILSPMVGVAPRTIIDYKKIYNSDNEEVKEQLRMDKISISAALRVIKEKPYQYANDDEKSVWDEIYDTHEELVNNNNKTIQTYAQMLKNSYIKLKRKELTDRIKKDVINKHKQCYICGEDFTPILLVHHILPLSEYGDNDFSNLTCLCPNCHKKMHYLYDSKDINFKTRFDYVFDSYSLSEQKKCLELYKQYYKNYQEDTEEHFLRDLRISDFIDKFRETA